MHVKEILYSLWTICGYWIRSVNLHWELIQLLRHFSWYQRQLRCPFAECIGKCTVHNEIKDQPLFCSSAGLGLADHREEYSLEELVAALKPCASYAPHCKSTHKFCFYFFSLLDISRQTLVIPLLLSMICQCLKCIQPKLQRDAACLQGSHLLDTNRKCTMLCLTSNR